MKEIHNNIACVYFTHEHPVVICDILKECAKLYNKYGIDIYIYDSSSDDNTKIGVEKLIQTGNDNIYYVDMLGIGADEKYIYYLNKYGFKKNYKYIWNTKDRVYLSESLLKQISLATNEDHDVIYAVDERERWELVIPPIRGIYNEPTLFYSHYGQLATNWECLIRRVDTMIDKFDVQDCIEKYRIGARHPFNQTVSLFVQLLKLDKCSIKVISTCDDILYYPGIYNGWINKVFDLWINNWIEANLSLPMEYNKYKLSVIKAETYMPFLFGSTDSFIRYLEAGLYNINVYEKYIDYWPQITDLPIEWLKYIAIGKIDELASEVVFAINEAFLVEDYPKAYRLFQTNQWLSKVYGEQNHMKLSFCFAYYRKEINEKCEADITKNIKSIEEFLSQYEKYKN